MLSNVQKHVVTVSVLMLAYVLCRCFDTFLAITPIFCVLLSHQLVTRWKLTLKWYQVG